MLKPNTNIYSKTKSKEARMLTNPTELCRHLDLLNKPFPLYDRKYENLYADVDTAYMKEVKPILANKNLLETNTAIEYMSKLIARKLAFNDYYASNSESEESLLSELLYFKEYHNIFQLKHNIGNKESFWYTSTSQNQDYNNGFIKSLSKAIDLLNTSYDQYIPNTLPRGKVITIHFPVTDVSPLYKGHPVNKTTTTEKYKGNLTGFCEILKSVDPYSYVIFGDNIVKGGKGGQASIRDESNSYGIPTKWNPSNSLDSFFADIHLPSIRESLDKVFHDLHSLLDQGYNLYFPNTGIGTGLSIESNPHSLEEISKYFTEKLRELGVNFDEVRKPFVKNTFKKEVPLIPDENPFEIPKESSNQVVMVISGGQTGVDLGALKGATELGIKTGGFAPYQFLTEKGKQKNLLSSYGLIEDISLRYSTKPIEDYKDLARQSYRSRTELNVIFSGGTIVFDLTNNYQKRGKLTPGSQLTVNSCKKYGKPYLINPSPSQFKTWVTLNNIKILNVAGNRESVSPYSEEMTYEFLYENLI